MTYAQEHPDWSKSQLVLTAALFGDEAAGFCEDESAAFGGAPRLPLNSDLLL